MKMSSIVDIINHYQKSIDRSLNDEARLVHCIEKLYRLPVSVQHLQETGIGRTVNGLRKYDGEVGVAAKALVSKWKNMVAAEESDTGEPEPQHPNHEEDEEEEDEENNEEARLQVDEDRHSDDHQEEELPEENENQEVEEEQHHQEEESDEEEMHTPLQDTNGHDSDHRSAHSSHRDTDRHRSSSKHKSDHNSHRSSSNSKHSSRSHDRHEKRRDGDKSQHHSSSSSSSSSKGHSSSPSSSKKSSRHEKEEKERKERHSSSRKDSSHANGKESSHSSSKEKTSDKHHSKSEESLNGFPKADESTKRRRTSEDEEESAVKKAKSDQPSESKSKSKSKSSSSSKDRSSSKSSSSSVSSKEKDKHRSSEKKKESSSKRKNDQSPDNCDEEEEDNGGGSSFADALAMIGMPSTSKKKTSTKGNVDKSKTSTSSMPPPPAKSDKHRSSSSSRSSSSKRSLSPNSSGYSSGSSTPSLLTQKPKLAPLQIAEIVDSLPMISPNYRPMPLNQTVMECVFSNNGKPQKRPMTEEEALGHSMQSKNLRTKVYSGVKNCNMEVPKLYSICIRLLQEHIDLIDYTGGIPFDLLKPVLERASPQQLLTLENYNPYLMEDSDVLWEQHCRRNFRSQKRKEEECESWREMFIRCSEERETKLLSLTANIRQSQVAKAAPIRKTQLAYVDSAVKPPRNVISKQARYGTAQAPVVSPAARVAALKNATSNLAKAGDSRLKVAAGIRDTAQVQVFQPTKPKKAPLMSKVMQSIKGFKGFRR